MELLHKLKTAFVANENKTDKGKDDDPDSNNPKEEQLPKGDWTCQGEIGSGCFGRVLLWKNAETGEVLALKTFDKSVTKNRTKLKARWTEEAGLSRSLQHENIIRGYKVPSILGISNSSFPPIAMEFCVGGSLGDLLNKPEHVFGLPEYKVLNVATDICHAVEYLHLRNILHRDIKPGNIILKDSEPYTTYKLIDFGFAKDLVGKTSTHSVCGTPMYIAPEIIDNKQYRLNVDYWSVGSVVFKCITGMVPFPNYKMAKGKYWREHVLGKQQDIIYIRRVNDGQVELSNKIPSPNHICSVTKSKFEKWLKIMLDSDPIKRGGDNTVVNGRLQCFAAVDAIATSKIMHIFCAESNRHMTMTIRENKDVRLSHVLEKIGLATGSHKDKLQFLSSSGDELPRDAQAKNYTGDNGDTKTMVYLFSSVQWSNGNLYEAGYPLHQIGTTVEYMINTSNRKNSAANQRMHMSAWMELMFYMRSVVDDYTMLHMAKHASMTNLLIEHAKLLKKHVLLSKAYRKGGPVITDAEKKDKIDRHKKKGKEDDDASSSLPENIHEVLDDKCNELNKQIDYLRMTGRDAKAIIEILSAMADSCKNVIERMQKDEDLKPRRDLMQRLLSDFDKQYEKAFDQIQQRISSICTCRRAIRKALPELDRCWRTYERSKSIAFAKSPNTSGVVA